MKDLSVVRDKRKAQAPIISPQRGHWILYHAIDLCTLRRPSQTGDHWVRMNQVANDRHLKPIPSLADRSLRRQSQKVGAVCGKAARRFYGERVMKRAFPTATPANVDE